MPDPKDYTARRSDGGHASLVEGSEDEQRYSEDMRRWRQSNREREAIIERENARSRVGMMG